MLEEIILFSIKIRMKEPITTADLQKILTASNTFKDIYSYKKEIPKDTALALLDFGTFPDVSPYSIADQKKILGTWDKCLETIRESLTS